MEKIFDTEVTDERIIHLAAGGCFQPNDKDATIHAMQCVIEMLVLSDPKKAYSLEEITEALRLKICRTTVAPDPGGHGPCTMCGEYFEDYPKHLKLYHPKGKHL